MTRKVLLFTGSRAEYGLLYWLMRDIQNCHELQLQVLVSAMHLSPEFGATWRLVEKDGFKIDAKVEMVLSSDSSVGTVKSMGVGLIGLADALDRLRPDVAVVLGDRFEALAFAQAALLMGVPLAHIHGGELTEGAVDDAIRHSITKMAQIHFVAAETYRARVIQLGEHPTSVFNVGALGLENIRRMELAGRAEVMKALGVKAPYFLITYHPVTAGEEDPAGTISCLLDAALSIEGMSLLVTYPNADKGGRAIIRQIERYATGHPERVVLRRNLAARLYLAAMRDSEAVVGNSSSGLIEAPAFKVPTVNVGIRQVGRLYADSVICCGASASEISAALKEAMTQNFRERCAGATNPYGAGDVSARIVHELCRMSLKTRKAFYDVGRPS